MNVDVIRVQYVVSRSTTNPHLGVGISVLPKVHAARIVRKPKPLPLKTVRNGLIELRKTVCERGVGFSFCPSLSSSHSLCHRTKATFSHESLFRIRTYVYFLIFVFRFSRIAHLLSFALCDLGLQSSNSETFSTVFATDVPKDFCYCFLKYYNVIHNHYSI